MTVLEEEVQERTQAPMRRFVVRRPSTGTDPSAGLRREVDRVERRPVRDEPPDPPPARRRGLTAAAGTIARWASTTFRG